MIKYGVESYLISGADLMWPGIARVKVDEFEPSFEGMPKKKAKIMKEYLESTFVVFKLFKSEEGKRYEVPIAIG